MIKVLQFIHGFNMGGAETIVKNYCLNFNKNNIDLYVLCWDRYNSPYDKELKDAGINVKYLCDDMPFYGKEKIIFRIINKIQLYANIKKYINNLNPDIIHTHLLVNKYIKFSRPKKNTKIFYTHHFSVERWKNCFKSEIKKTRWLIDNYDTTIVALNSKMKDDINNLFNIQNTIVLNNGIAMDEFFQPMSKNEKRKELNLNESTFVVGHVGRFSKIKNHDFLIDVFVEIQKKKKNAILLLVGKGEQKKHIIDKSEKLGIRNNLIILSDRTDIDELMKIMDILIFPSFSEGVPVTLVEAQAAGLKCIVSDTITKEVCYSNLLKYKSIIDSPNDWAREALKWSVDKINYCGIEKWDLKLIIKELEDRYTKSLKGDINE